MLVSVACAPSASAQAVGRAASTVSAWRTCGSATSCRRRAGALETTTGRWRAPRGRRTPAAGCGSAVDEALRRGRRRRRRLSGRRTRRRAPASGEPSSTAPDRRDARRGERRSSPRRSRRATAPAGRANRQTTASSPAAAMVAWASTRPPLDTTYHRSAASSVGGRHVLGDGHRERVGEVAVDRRRRSTKRKAGQRRAHVAAGHREQVARPGSRCRRTAAQRLSGSEVRWPRRTRGDLEGRRTAAPGVDDRGHPEDRQGEQHGG